MSVTDKRVRKKRRWGKVFEYTSYERSLLVGNEYEQMLKELEAEFAKRKSVMITPQELAVKRDIRVSTAKRLLEDLVGKNIIKKVHQNRRIRVYVKA
ncbi:MAG: hypothetical protein ACTSR2_05770 [Candidatus Hodarchaeales archaeon]